MLNITDIGEIKTRPVWICKFTLGFTGGLISAWKGVVFETQENIETAEIFYPPWGEWNRIDWMPRYYSERDALAEVERERVKRIGDKRRQIERLEKVEITVKKVEPCGV